MSQPQEDRSLYGARITAGELEVAGAAVRDQSTYYGPEDEPPHWSTLDKEEREEWKRFARAAFKSVGFDVEG